MRVALIELETFIAAPPERCFDLSLSVELHLDSTAATRERAIAGRTSGVLALGDDADDRPVPLRCAPDAGFAPSDPAFQKIPGRAERADQACR
jgi:hypothetical protein